MPWNAPIVPVSNTVITVAYAASNIVDPINWLRQITGGNDPGAANRVLVSTGAVNAVWGQVPDAALAVPKVSRAGDVMTFDLQINRSAGAAPTLGYLILGNNTAYYFAFDGAQHVLVTPRLNVQNDLYVHRVATPTQGYIILGNNSAHFVGFDGTQIVADGSPVWTDANAPLRVTTPRIADLAVTTAKLADLAVTNAKIANATISGDAKLVPGSVTGNSGPSAIGSNVLHANRLQDGTMIAGEVNRIIPAGQIAADRLAVGVAVPSGLIAGFRTAAAIAAGWNRCDGSGGRPNLNGRLLVGATVPGTPIGGVDWPENAASGTSWTLQSATGLPPSGAVQGGGSSTTNPGDHTHAVPWTIPTFSVCWAIKS